MNIAEEVPLCLASLEYIPLPQEGADELSFYVSCDCTVYLCLPEDSADFDEMQTEAEACINSRLFGNKCRIVSLNAVYGQKISFKGNNGKLPLVLAKKL